MKVAFSRWPVHPFVAALVAAHLLLLWALPIPPAQDLPQHLAIARIFMDYGSGALPFHEYYTLPSRVQPYDSVYLLLAWLARGLGVLGAVKLLLSAYVVLVFVGFAQLADACHGKRRPGEPPRMSHALASLLVWSPAVVMGFLQFFLCVPVVLLAAAATLRCADPSLDARQVRRAVIGAAVGGALAASIHLVAAGALALFAILVVELTSWKQGGGGPGALRVLSPAAPIAGIGVALFGWHSYGDVLDARLGGVDLAGAIRDAQGFEFINSVFRLTWFDPLVTLNYVAWTVLGPFRWGGMPVSLVALGGLAHVLARARRNVRAPSDGEAIAAHAAPPRGIVRAALAFAVLACLLPWGMAYPSEITYLNFRVIGIAFALLLALVPPVRFDEGAPRVALGVACAVCFANYAVNAVLFQHEAGVPLRLLARANPQEGALLPLVFHNTSGYFGKGFRLTHFLPMYYTALDAGISTQFWARYTEHLPIDYQPGKRPADPGDWTPQSFDATKHLHDVRWVLIQLATGDDSPRAQQDSARAKEALDASATVVACEDPWCLYRVATVTSP